MTSTSPRSLRTSNDDIWLFRLQFLSPISEAVDSIKIYGAILSAMKQLYPENFEEFYAAVKNGTVKISSPLPIRNSKLYVLKPKLREDESDKFRKIFRKIAYIDIDDAQKALQKGRYTREFIEKIVNSEKLQIRSSEIPKVSVPRTGGKTNIYYMEEKYIGEVGILIRAGEFEKELNACLRYLGDRGISKKASWGLGAFSVKSKGEFEKKVSNSEYLYLVSKFAPTQEDVERIDFENSMYGLKTIIGRNRQGKSFKQRVLTEGSVLRVKELPLEGKVLELRNPDYSAVLKPMFI